MTQKEARKRSVVKSISWRVLATLTTIILVFIFTKNITISLEIGALEVVLKLVIYYFHERAWAGVLWGKK